MLIPWMAEGAATVGEGGMAWEIEDGEEEDSVDGRVSEVVEGLVLMAMKGIQAISHSDTTKGVRIHRTL